MTPNKVFEADRDASSACGTTGPFRHATDADLAAYLENTRAPLSDYLKTVALVIVIAAIVAIITKWMVDA